MNPPILFTFGVHIHQPVGNFDDVFQQHVDDVYLPFLGKLIERELFPFTLHISGPLLEWMEAHDGRVLDLIGPAASDGRIELLSSGLYEPVLASLSRRDRVEQVQGMGALLKRLFGVDATGLWLTERVWEPDLTSDLAQAGIRLALVDDHHFLAAGFEPDALHRPFWCEHDGDRIALFPIEERLRYLVPFQPPHELADHLRYLRAAGHRLAVLADDGEKFGGWPGTADWLYEQGWLEDFLSEMDRLRTHGDVAMTTFHDALVHVPSGGPAHLPTASYREMETWALPTPAGLRLQRLTLATGVASSGPDGALVRGSHWKNFLVKYREAHRMQQKAAALSELCRDCGDPPGPRRAIARAQCNDAYWHGVFGGLYLKHLRDAIWSNLAEAEEGLRRGGSLRVEERDLDVDGQPEFWVHSPSFSALVTPALGGAVEEYTVFSHRTNFANALTRRREVYHYPPPEVGEEETDTTGTASIHHLEAGFAADDLPPVDDHVRALFVDRVVEPDPASAEAAMRVVRSWAHEPLSTDECKVSPEVALIRLTSHDGSLKKTFRFDPAGDLTVDYRWTLPEVGPDARFLVELSFGSLGRLEWEPPVAACLVEPIETVSRTEEGLTTTEQGIGVTLQWPADQGRATVRIRPEPDTLESLGARGAGGP